MFSWWEQFRKSMKNSVQKLLVVIGGGLEGVSTLLEDLKKDHAKISTDTILSNIRGQLAYHGMILYLIPWYFTCFKIGLWIGHSCTCGPRAITELNEPLENRAWALALVKRSESGLILVSIDQLKNILSKSVNHVSYQGYHFIFRYPVKYRIKPLKYCYTYMNHL